jgi:hypothetical protein
LRDALGNFYTQIKCYDTTVKCSNTNSPGAIQTLIDTVQLKPDLAAARFDLARALVARADVDGTAQDRQRDYLTAAKNQYQATLNLVTPGSADEKQVNSELDSVTKKLDGLGGPAPTTSTPTVSPKATPVATTSGTKK